MHLNISIMIQRVQTLLWILNIVISSVLAFGNAVFYEVVSEGLAAILEFDEITINMGNEINFYTFPLLLLVIVLSLVAIFSFKNRSLQITLSMLLAILGIIILVAAVGSIYSTLFEIEINEIEPLIAVPILITIFSTIARKRVVKDERLVQSMDRLR